MFAAFPLPIIRFSDVKDGLSNTFMCGEALPSSSQYLTAFGNTYPVAPTKHPLKRLRPIYKGRVRLVIPYLQRHMRGREPL